MPQTVRVPKDLRILAKKARQQGWVITRTNNSHFRWQSPRGAIIITGGTPSVHKRGNDNAFAFFKKEGLL